MSVGASVPGVAHSRCFTIGTVGAVPIGEEEKYDACNASLFF